MTSQPLPCRVRAAIAACATAHACASARCAARNLTAEFPLLQRLRQPVLGESDAALVPGRSRGRSLHRSGARDRRARPGATWIDDIRCWPAPGRPTTASSLLTRRIALAAASLRAHRPGIGPRIRRADAAYRFSWRIRNRLAGIELVDGSPCIWEVRRIKSPAEVVYIRECCQLVSARSKHLPQQLAVGAHRSRSLPRSHHRHPESRRAHRALPRCRIWSRRLRADHLAPETPRAREGDILIIDVGATINGYFCDFDRNYGFGQLERLLR